MNREIKFEFIFQHPKSKEVKIKRFTLQEIIEQTDDDLLMLECDCEPIGETNVVECNCEDYLEEFLLIAKRQFTGRKDKNGKEIYEGYFIEDEGGRDYLVDFRNGAFMAIHRPSCRAEIEGEPMSDYLYDFDTSTHHEIIGNIDSNPELLK